MNTKAEWQDLISQMYDAIIDFSNDKIDWGQVRRKVGQLEEQYRKLRGGYYHRSMGYQTIASFIYQRWG